MLWRLLNKDQQVIARAEPFDEDMQMTALIVLREKGMK
jgi:hypothetical protein